MATHASSTTVSDVQPRLLRPLTFRPAPPVVDHHSADELPNYLGNPEVVGSPLLLAFHGDTPIRPAAGQNPKPPAVPHNGAGCVDIDMPLAAHALHMRRELHQALDHGFALLDALDLPPMALDVIDDAIATMDALDGEMDLEEDGGSEPSLGAPENHPDRWHVDMDGAYHAGRSRHPLGDQTHWSAGGTSDREGEHDGREHEAGYDLAEGDDERCASGEVDGEYSCGWTAKVSQIHLGVAQDDHESTALERYGKGFIRSGPDDAEDGHDAETVYEDGSKDEPYGWRFQRSDAIQHAAHLAEVAHHV